MTSNLKRIVPLALVAIAFTTIQADARRGSHHKGGHHYSSRHHVSDDHRNCYKSKGVWKCSKYRSKRHDHDDKHESRERHHSKGHYHD